MPRGFTTVCKTMLTSWHKALNKILSNIAKAPAFYSVVGLALITFFLPMSVVLVRELIFHTDDLLAGAERLAPAVTVMSITILIIGILLVFCSVRNGSTPGSIFYRLTHAPRKNVNKRKNNRQLRA